MLQSSGYDENRHVNLLTGLGFSVQSKILERDHRLLAQEAEYTTWFPRCANIWDKLQFDFSCRLRRHFDVLRCLKVTGFAFDGAAAFSSISVAFA